MAVSLTTTLNSSYGSKIVVTGAGFLLNNEMNDFSVKPDTMNQFDLIGREANAIAPNKRMLSSMSPTIVAKDGQAILVTGSKYAFSPDTLRALMSLGHVSFFQWPYGRGIGDANSVMRRDGVLHGVKDPRAEGVAVGF